MRDSSQAGLDKDTLDRTIEILQLFIDGVLESEILRSSPYLLNFLSCVEETDWIKKKEEFDKTVKKTSGIATNYSRKLFENKNPLKVEDFESLDGILQCRITNNLKDYSVELDELVKTSEPLYKK